ncbi:MAG: hypothetical protein ABIN01_03790 [Ferruginibacter sp.]
MSIPYAHHQTEAFKYLIIAIRQYFRAQQIPVYTETPKAFDHLYPPGRKKTKKALMHTLTFLYPQLTLCYSKEVRNKNKYYIKVFEAVAAAHLHQ